MTVPRQLLDVYREGIQLWSCSMCEWAAPSLRPEANAATSFCWHSLGTNVRTTFLIRSPACSFSPREAVNNDRYCAVNLTEGAA